MERIPYLWIVRFNCDLHYNFTDCVHYLLSLWVKPALFHYCLFCKAPLWEWFMIDVERWKEFITHYSSSFFYFPLPFSFLDSFFKVCMYFLWTVHFLWRFCTSNQCKCAPLVCIFTSVEFACVRGSVCSRSKLVNDWMFAYSVIVCIWNLTAIGPDSIDKMGGRGVV